MALPGFLYRNLAAGLTPASGSSTAASGFPWSNLDNPQPRKRARSTGNSTTLIWDLGSAMSVDFAYLGSTSAEAGASCSARLRASTADPTVVASLLYDSGINASVTDPEYHGNIGHGLTTPMSARYWRWDISTLSVLEVGVAMLGLLLRPENGVEYGFQEGRIDHSIRDLNEDTGGEFAVFGPKQRALQFVLGATESEVRGLTTSFSDMDRLIGASGDVLFVEDSADTWIDIARDSLYGSFREVGASLATRQANTFWTRVFQMRERL